MANLLPNKPPASASNKRMERKSAAAKPKMATFGYAFAGTIAELPKTLGEGFLSGRVRTVFIPETPQAEDVLKSSKRFSRVRLHADSLALLGFKKPKNISREGQIDAEAYTPNARAKAILRGRQYAAEDLKAAGGAYSIDDVKALLNNISRQAIDKRINDGGLLAVPGPGGTRCFPTAQFDKHGSVVKGLKAVQKALGFTSPWAVLNFLVNENDQLSGQRPIDLLHRDEVDPVVLAASSVGVQGA